MSVPPEPPRLLDAATTPDSLRAMLLAARPRAPTDAQIARMGEAIRARTAAPPAPSVAPRGWPTRRLLALGVGVAALLAALWWAASRRPRAPAPTRPAAPVSRVADLPAALRPVGTEAPVGPAQVARVEVPRARAAPAPLRRVVAQGVPARGGARAVTAAPAPAEATAACSEAEHFERVQGARRRLREGDWAASQALCADDAAACPGGTFAEERERVWIEALARGGRDREARARWERFVAAFPTSAYRARLRALLGESP